MVEAFSMLPEEERIILFSAQVQEKKEILRSKAPLKSTPWLSMVVRARSSSRKKFLHLSPTQVLT